MTADSIAKARESPKGYDESVPKTVTKHINRDYPQFEEGTVLTEEFIGTLTRMPPIRSMWASRLSVCRQKLKSALPDYELLLLYL